MMLCFRPRFSIVLLLLWLLLHLGAALCLWRASLAFYEQVFIFIALCGHAWLFYPSLTVLELAPDGQYWRIRFKGKEEWVVLEDRSVLMRGMLLLHFRTLLERSHRTLLLFPDALPGRQWWQLLGCLKTRLC